jgi:diguanylate cyclase (GGDEF)-like protein/PAS domain S-box-containing protein
LRERSASSGSRSRFSGGQRWSFALRLGGCFLSVGLSTATIVYFEHNEAGTNLIWVANGLLLTYLLLTPRWRWPAYAAAGLAGMIGGGLLAHEPWFQVLWMNLLNLAEVTLAALLLRRRSAQLPCFVRPGYLVQYAAYAVLAAPGITGLIYALIMDSTRHSGLGFPFFEWFITDALGIAVGTPTFVAIFRSRFTQPVNWRRQWVFLPVLAIVSYFAFYRSEVPAVLLFYPILVLILLQMGLGRASIATLCVAVFSGWCTVRGHGAFALTSSISHYEPAILLQVFAASAIFMLYAVSVTLEGRRVTERRLEKIVALHNLVTENSRDAIVISDFSGQPSYVSPSMRMLGGWGPEEIAGQRPLELAHPGDLENIKEALRELHDSIDSTVIELRTRTRKGDYIWVECSMRVYRDPATGKRAGILNLVRNISERKRAEQELQAAYIAVESMAVVDALTGLANRRRFDEYLTKEWRREMRDGKSLSLLMLDADHFKSYNDAYGHVRGDGCLKQIAEACMDVVARPGDLVARYGGEEFAIILPETDNKGAMQVGNEICEALRNRRLKHEANPNGIVTISVGCATMVPERGRHSTDMVETADKALYLAKHSGRNQVCNASAMDDSTNSANPEQIPIAITGMAAELNTALLLRSQATGLR